MSKNVFLLAFLLIAMWYVIIRAPREEKTIEHLSSDFGNSFYGVQLWNGWPY